MGSLARATVGQPYLPIPSGEIAEDYGRHSLIRRVDLFFRSRYGVPTSFETDRAYVVFTRLREAARNGEEVTHFSCGGLDADADSVAALNCYLRTGRAMRRMRLPFDRLSNVEGGRAHHRFEWAEFCTYLDLNFQ